MTIIAPNNRYLGKWEGDPSGKDFFEFTVLEISPSRTYVRVLWEVKPDFTTDQEWLRVEELAQHVVEQLPVSGAPVQVSPLTSSPRGMRPMMPGMIPGMMP